MVSKADVTLPQATPEVAEVVEVASLSGTVRGMVSIAVEEEDLRLFLSDPDLDSRLLLLLSLLLVLPSFDMVMEEAARGAENGKCVRCQARAECSGTEASFGRVSMMWRLPKIVRGAA